MRGMPAAVSAMVFYDTLSYDRKWINDDDKKIPGHETFSAEQIHALEPILDPAELKGGVIYYDCQMYSPERLTLEPILSAAEYRADVANYALAEDLISEGERITGARVMDLMNGKEFEIKASVTVNAAGPWADLLLGKIRGKKHHGLVRSKGIHIITRSLHKDHAIVLQTKTGRHFFIIPWRGFSLIGTTDVVYKGQPDDFKVTEADIAGFLAEINATVPAARLTRDDVKFQYGGLRPIVEKETSVEVEVYDASRKYELYDHETDEGVKGFVTAIGGKYTTSRNMARQLVDMIFTKLKREAVKCQTHTTPLYGGEIGRFSSFVERAKLHKPEELDNAVMENLCRNYGSRYVDVIKAAEKKKHLGIICEAFMDIWAEVFYAIRCEMAVSLSDVLFRRTGLCTLGNPGTEVIEEVADVMAKELKWKKAMKHAEIEKVLDAFTVRMG
jgi:glycerol-3-phosphate dehydrogenase